MLKIVNTMPFILYCVWLCFNIKTVGRLVSMSTFIIFIYTLSMFSYAICSLIYDDYYYSLYGLTLITMPLFLFTRPLARFERKISSNSKFSYIDPKRCRIVIWFVIFIGLYALYFFSLNLQQVFSSDLATLRHKIVVDGAFYESSIFSKLAVLGAYLSPIALLLYFYNLITGSSKSKSILLILSSLSFIVYTLNVAGRDGFVIWILSYVSLFCLFYPLLSEKNKKMQLYLFAFAIAFVVPIFMFISIQRFSSYGKMDIEVLGSLFDYLGQQLHELSFRLDELMNMDYKGEPRSIIPLLYDFWCKIWGIENTGGDRFDLRLESMTYGLNTYRFSFFVGSIVTELGNIGVFLYTLLTLTIIKTNLKFDDRNITLSRLIIIFTWFMPIIIGVFYFYYGQVIGNVFLIIPFILFLYLMDTKNGHKRVRLSDSTSNKVVNLH